MVSISMAGKGGKFARRPNLLPRKIKQNGQKVLVVGKELACSAWSGWFGGVQLSGASGVGKVGELAACCWLTACCWARNEAAKADDSINFVTQLRGARRKR